MPEPATPTLPARAIIRKVGLRQQLAGWLAGEELHGTLWRAGLPKTFEAAL